MLPDWELSRGKPGSISMTFWLCWHLQLEPRATDLAFASKSCSRTRSLQWGDEWATSQQRALRKRQLRARSPFGQQRADKAGWSAGSGFAAAAATTLGCTPRCVTFTPNYSVQGGGKGKISVSQKKFSRLAGAPCFEVQAGTGGGWRLPRRCLVKLGAVWEGGLIQSPLGSGEVLRTGRHCWDRTAAASRWRGRSWRL